MFQGRDVVGKRANKCYNELGLNKNMSQKYVIVELRKLRYYHREKHNLTRESGLKYDKTAETRGPAP